MSDVVWVCDRCNRTLEGNPRCCPWCGYTVYRPTFPKPKDESPVGSSEVTDGRP